MSIKSIVKIFSQNDRIFLVLLLLSVALLYSFISIAKHERFETFGWDLAYQEQIIWKWSNFKISYMSMKGNINSLGDHFTLTWILLIPLYLINSSPKTLLISQAFVTTFAAFPLYYLGKILLKSYILSFSVVISYLFFVSLQHGVFNDVHSAMYTTIFITSALLFLEKRDWSLYWLSTLGLAFTKEEFGLLVAAIGIVIILRRINYTHGILSILFGIFIFFFLTMYLMPFASQTPKFVHSSFGQAGSSIDHVARKFVTEPGFVLMNIYNSPIKEDTLLKYLSASGFLPLLSPVNLIPIFQQITIRFIDSYHPIRWMANNHYSGPMAALLAVSTIYGLSNLIRILKKFHPKFDPRFTLSILIISVAILQDIMNHGPINSIFKKQFYEKYPWMVDNQEVINRVPRGVSLATNNNLAAHLAGRDLLYLLPDINSAEYIAVDLLDGPNKYAPTDYENVQKLIYQVKKDPDYKLIYKSGQAYLFKRVGSKNGPGFYNRFYVPQPI